LIRSRKLIWQIFPSFLLIILLGLSAVVYLSVRTQNRTIREQTRATLITKTGVVSHVLEKMIARDWYLQHRLGDRVFVDFGLYDLFVREWEGIFEGLSDQVDTRFTFMLVNGLVIFDNENDPRLMENHANRPEIVQALNGEIGASTRFSKTLQKEMMYVALPVYFQGELIAIARAAMPLQEVEHLIASTSGQFIAAVFFMALLAGIVTFYMARRISKPLADLETGAARFAAGDLSYRLPAPKTEEIQSLATTMNQMAGSLAERIDTITRQRNELEAVLTSMVEAVLVVDQEKRLLRCNERAAVLFGFAKKQATDRPLAELVRNPELLAYLERTLGNASSDERPFFWAGGDRFWQVHTALLHSQENQPLGALIMLRDVTREQHIEKIRRDFVANVSHELKTPITSIKGFVETLRDGAINEAGNAEKFLGIIAKHVSRLEAIIEDLLSLSRIEQDEGNSNLYQMPGQLRDVIDSAVLICGNKARDKSIEIVVHLAEEITARMNPALLEQALVNLLDNAVKYSPPKSRITIQGRRDRRNMVIEVIDQGSGIPEEYHHRIFERFYRVDKARSRAMGGTGLGLSIVKHIMTAHSGRVTVESQVGQGSIFSLILPLTDD